MDEFHTNTRIDAAIRKAPTLRTNGDCARSTADRHCVPLTAAVSGAGDRVIVQSGAVGRRLREALVVRNAVLTEGVGLAVRLSVVPAAQKGLAASALLR